MIFLGANDFNQGLIIDYKIERKTIKPNNGLGGIGGQYIKPVALANVYNFYNRLQGKIAIIGCGE